MKFKTYANKLISVIFPFIFLTFSVSCKTNDGKKTIKVIHHFDISHPIHHALVFMAEDLEKRSNRSMELKIFPDIKKKNRKQAFEMLQAGSLGMTCVSVDFMQNYLSKMKIFQQPYLFDNHNHLHKTLDGAIGKELLNGQEKHWFKGLGYFNTGSRNFYTKEKHIKHPEDFENLKINLIGENSIHHLVSSQGGNATVLSKNDLKRSLETDSIHGSEGNLSNFYSLNHYEICKFYTLHEHAFSPEIIAIGQTLWSSLSDQQQKWLEASVKESIVYQRKVLMDTEQTILSKIKQEGVQIIEIDKNEFIPLAQKSFSEHVEDAEIQDIIEQIQAVRIE